MRLIFTLFSFLLLSITADAQNITGIWRGYFSSARGLYREDVREEYYKYEVQIEQLTTNGVKGVTYSYKTTVFYGKAELQGIYSPEAQSLTIKETKLTDLKIGDKSEPCLMTCYLDYSKMGKLEVLQGTFISVNANTKADCGSGKVYLEKVPVSEFKKEDFLLKKKFPDTPKKEPAPLTKLPVRPAKPAPKTTPPAAKNNTVPNKTTPGATNKTPLTTPRNRTQAPATGRNNAPAKKQNQPQVRTPQAENKSTKPAEQVPEARSWKQDTAIVIQPEKKEPPQRIPVPRVLAERENNLVKTIYTDEEDINIAIYDNGTIDNDTISLYHNNRLAISHGKLTYNALTLKFRCDKQDPRHELVMVAENMGEIPPNTALMVITIGKNKKRMEIFLTSTEKRNAKVVIEYRPGG
ncbi:hypothetical protein [Sediminibacterium ginsengisoli]|uniref:Uncharacterized protein n=1 Tax=Sediminibacterium ginsengisoli TaxID=413434 RepID=A0A1T4RT43_9BACT|nr:hypothetical protein [Sediminibacterium ginsengisoli]SKA19154.1 hypothetical protein SAMN04488132_11469 [Sediminibacterium ginsengisoli]